MDPTPKQRGADALAATLAAHGVRRVFTLSGNHVMALFDATIEAGIELVHVRHEAAAVHMADAWARLTGEVGIAVVTGGPGHANAIGALYTAAMAESPVVLLSGHAPLKELGMAAFQEMRQPDMAAPVTKISGMSRRAEDLARDCANGIAIALDGRPGPVHLSIPGDVLEGAAPGAAIMPTDPVRPTDDWSPFAARLAKAARPLILCGPICLTRTGRERMAALEDATGIPVVGMESPRGVGDPSLGAFQEMLAQADCVLLLGKRCDFTLKFGRALGPECEVLQIDPDPTEVDRSRRAFGDRLKLTSRGAALPAIDALVGSAKPTAGPWREEVRAAIAYRPAAWDSAAPAGPGRLHPVQALRPLQSILDSHPEAVLVSDGGEIGQWAQACLSAPHRVINGVAGSIGAGLPFAVAARLARPQAPVIAVMGDGTFGFHPAEIDTAVRYGLPFVAVVGNDARWNAEYQIQVRDFGRERAVGCELLPTRYDQVAVAFGGHGELVTEAGQLLPAAHRALESRLPAVLNVMIDGLPAPNLKRP